MVACVLGEPLGAAESRKLNVLFVIADDLRPELGCYGVSAVHSPNIDRLAARGLVFDRAYCQMALCNPSRASFLTGRRPDATQVFDNGAHFRAALPEAIALPQHFKQHGYHTQGLGKIYHPGCADAPSWSVPPWVAGKSDDDAQGAALVEEMASYYGPQGRALVRKRMEQVVKSGKPLEQLKRRDLLGPAWEAPVAADDDLVDGKTAARAVQVLREVKDRPFFLALGFLKPHLPFVAPKKYWDLYPPDRIAYVASPPPKDVPACALHQWTELRAFLDMPATGPLSDEQARQAVRGYRAATSYLDAQVGRVLDELDRLGLRDRTIVVLLGDHGWQLGEHGLWCKHTNFEVATRAPLIVAAPGMKAVGRHTGALVEFVDIYPTLAEMCGLPAPAHLEGTSFAPLLASPEQPWKRASFSQYLRPGKDKIMGRSIRTERWRYTEWIDTEKEAVGIELYDEQNDPKENMNIANDPAKQDIVADLARQLKAGWRAAVPLK
jgi:iduronate 2-sulfatase